MNKKILLVGAVIILIVVVLVISTSSDSTKDSESVLSDTEQNVEVQDEMMTAELAGERVEYVPGTDGYLSLPEGDGPHPGLILIHEWWGLNDDIKSIADRFASQGYAALAVDMYDGEVTTERDRARELSSAVRDDVEGAFVNLEAALDYLRGREDVDVDRLASVGWCFGGGWAYQMALNGLDIDASVMYYGQFNPDDDFDMMKGDILGHFGEEDAAIAIDEVKEFQAALATTNGAHEVFIYPNVGHGFANLRGGENLAYSEAEAEIAWQRTLDFLTQRFSDGMLEYESSEMGISFEYSSRLELNDNKEDAVSLRVYGPTQKEGTEVYDGLVVAIKKYGLEGKTLESVAKELADESDIHGDIVKPLTPVTVGNSSGWMYTTEGLGIFDVYVLPVGDESYLSITVLLSDPEEQGFGNMLQGVLDSLEVL